MKFSRQAQLCMVGVFQRGLLGLSDASKLLNELEFQYEMGELKVSNPEICQITNEEHIALQTSANVSKHQDA